MKVIYAVILSENQPLEYKKPLWCIPLQQEHVA